MSRITNKHIIKIKELISDEVCLGALELVELAELLMQSENLEASAIILRDFAEKCYQEGVKNASSNSDCAKSKNCANCSKLYQCNDVRRHPEWHCEKHDFA